jgi:hypothetical protein
VSRGASPLTLSRRTRTSSAAGAYLWPSRDGCLHVKAQARVPRLRVSGRWYVPTSPCQPTARVLQGSPRAKATPRELCRPPQRCATTEAAARARAILCACPHHAVARHTAILHRSSTRRFGLPKQERGRPTPCPSRARGGMPPAGPRKVERVPDLVHAPVLRVVRQPRSSASYSYRGLPSLKRSSPSSGIGSQGAA